MYEMPDVEGGCFGDEVTEGNDYPYNDDRFTLSPAEFLVYHRGCLHIDPTIDRLRAEIHIFLTDTY